MRTIFLDRDGVINQNRPDYVKRWSEFSFLRGALAALRLLTRHGFQIFVVTNQACINRGLADRAAVEMIHKRMVLGARASGAIISDVRYCPHRSDEGCDCRKPKPGMLLALAQEHRVDLTRAYLVGDALSDIAAGTAAGCRTALVLTGRGAQQRLHCATEGIQPHSIVSDLMAATEWVLRQEGLPTTAAVESVPVPLRLANPAMPPEV